MMTNVHKLLDATLSLYVDESWVIQLVTHRLISSYIVLILVALLIVYGVGMWMFNNWKFRLFTTTGMLALLLTSIYLPLQRQDEARIFAFVGPESSRLLIREQPSWLSTELDFCAPHRIVGWRKVGNDESTNSVFRPFSDGDYALTWNSSTEVTIRWLFNESTSTYRTVTLQLG